MDKRKDDIYRLLSTQPLPPIPADMEQIVMHKVGERSIQRAQIKRLKDALVFSFLLALYFFTVLFLQQIFGRQAWFQDVKMLIVVSIAVFSIYKVVSWFSELLPRRQTLG